MKHSVNHDLSPALARKATDKAWEVYSKKYAKYNPQATWTSDTTADIQFQAKGVTLDGVMTLEKKEISLDIDVPFLLRPFVKMAIGVIEKEILFWIAKAKAGELDDA